MRDRIKLLHPSDLLHRHKSFIHKGFLKFAHSGVKLVKHFAITHVEKFFFYAYRLLGKNASLASLLHRRRIYG